MRQKFTTLRSTVVPLPIENIDTDQIIPARFLKATTREGFGENLFRDWRYDKDGNPKKLNFVTGGTMTISVEGDAYTIACDFTDVNGTKIKAEYSDVVEYSDLSSQMFAVPSVAAPYESLYSFSTAARLAKGSLRPFNL